MSIFSDFDNLRGTVNRLLGDFDYGLRGGGRRVPVSSCGNPSCPCGDACGCGVRCQCGSTTTARGSLGFGSSFGGFPSMGGWGSWDEDILDMPLLTTGGFGGVNPWITTTTGTFGGGLGQQVQPQLKAGEETKMEDVAGGTQQGGTQLATRGGETQLGTMQPTFRPGQIMRARVNVEDQKDKFVVTAEMPGFDKNNIKVNVTDDGLLTIKGEQSQEHIDQAKDKRYLKAERTFANVQRTLRIPKGCDASKIAASYENGILHVNLPKTPEAEKAKHEIQIA